MDFDAFAKDYKLQLAISVLLEKVDIDEAFALYIDKKKEKKEKEKKRARWVVVLTSSSVSAANSFASNASSSTDIGAAPVSQFK